VPLPAGQLIDRLRENAEALSRGDFTRPSKDVEPLTIWTFNDEGKVTRVEAFAIQEEDAAVRAFRAA
jgi:hypothetical protein